jgi:hypothetical protein
MMGLSAMDNPARDKVFLEPFWPFQHRYVSPLRGLQVRFNPSKPSKPDVMAVT